ncbi:suppressor of tumorigenicity 7 protein-like isoform X6 [Canis aureus]
MEAKTFQQSEVTSQSSSSRIGAASLPFPPSEGKVDWDAPPPSKWLWSAFLGPELSQRPPSGPPLSQDSRLPVSCPSPLPAPGACGSGKMADGGGLGEAASAAAAPPAPTPGPSPSLGWRERLRAGLAGTGPSLWFVAGLGLLYALRVPLRLCENLAAVTVFLNSLTPKFYVALTGTSSLISGLIFIFEWWYFHKHGTSFIEQVSVSHLRPLMGATESSISEPGSPSSNRESETSRQNLSECKVWRNPLNLFRGAEYRRYTWVTGKEPLTYYDMNLSAQDHQTFFTCDTDFLRPSDTVMQKAWRERNPPARIKAAYQALELNNDCATAYVLLAEEEATTIVDAERLFKQALKAGETIYRRSQQCQHQSPQHEAQLRRDTNVLVYIKRRLAMCARKLGRIREAVKIMRDLMKEFPPLTMLNIHENLLESLLELQAYADVQAVLAKYDDISLPKSAAICYTAALLKTRTVSDKFSPETASRRGLSTAEINAVEAIHRAVEFNPHVPKILFYLLMRDTEREREAETQAEEEAGSMQGTRRGTRSQDSRIMPWAAGCAKLLRHRGYPIQILIYTLFIPLIKHST